MDNSGHLLIYADGGSRGNPGPAGAGAVLILEGRNIFELSEYLGEATNNVAEYAALVKALSKGLELGFESVEVRMDSELVVRQMNGQYKVKNQGLLPLFQKARQLAQSYSQFKIVHVPRALNRHADKLANQAMDSASKV